jgi:hypothetical protein
MMSRGILRTSLAVLLCLAVIPAFSGCGDKKTTAPIAATGACCVGSSCMVLSSANCSQNGGSYRGDNTSCATNPCVSQTTGTISGVVSLPPGLPGDLGNARVGLFTSIDNWSNDISARPFGRVSGSGPTVNISETGVTPGSYFVEVWSDVDHSGTFTTGDWWGISGTSTWPNPVPTMVMVSAGGTATVSIYLIAIP